MGDGVDDGLFWHQITAEDLRLITNLSLAVQDKNVGGIQYFCKLIWGWGLIIYIIYLCILLQSHCMSTCKNASNLLTALHVV